MRALYGFPESEPAARRLAGLLGLPYRAVALRRFPDGESLVRVHPPASEAILYRSLDRPNDKLVEILLAAAALRDGGCRRLTLVAPYMAYMRQDMAFTPGEAVSQRVVGRLIAGAVDRVVTVNPHLHRTAEIGAVFPGIEAVALDAAPSFAAWVAGQGIGGGCVVLGPDAESAPWAAALAARLGAEAATGRKRRHGDRDVSIALPEQPRLAGRTVLLLDDVASSGATLGACAEAARAAGAVRVIALVAHALHGAAAAARLAAAGIERVASTDSVPHPSNAVELAPLLAAALDERHAAPATGGRR